MLVLHRGLCRRAIPGALALVAACSKARPAPSPSSLPAPSTTGFSTEVRDGLARVRAATSPFIALDSAVAAGYARDVQRCLAHPQHGAMGFHHVNRSLVDARVEVDRPEILLYERREDRYVLNGVEFIVPYTRWPRDSAPPSVLGQNLKRSDELRLWYLHMWAWRENSAGLFADWNPAVRCPAR